MDQRALVERAGRGDHDAFAQLARASVARLDAAARLILRDREAASDAVQETLIRAWRNLPGLRDPERFDGWLHRLLVRSCIDALRRRGARPIEVELQPIDGPHIPDLAIGVVERELIDDALRRLDPTWRAVVVLHYFLGMPLPEAASVLGIPLGTAKSRLHRSLGLMRLAISDEVADAIAPERTAGMTTDRLERRLPEVLTELALPRVPDYFDNLIDRTARMPQRPGWTFPERWFPVSTLTATLSNRRLSLRPLLVVALLIALVIASIIFVVGTQRHPAPVLGLARNGVVVTTSATGDLVAVNPATGDQHTLIAGPNLCCASLSRDGTRLAMLRVAPGSGDATGLAVANADGSGVREFPKELIEGLISFEWSAEGDRILITNAASALVLDVESGSTTAIPPSNAMRAAWIGTSGDILVTSTVVVTTPNGSTLSVDRVTPGLASRTVRVAELDNAVDAPLVAPDGSKFLYFIWGPDASHHGDLHVFDFAKGTDTALTEEAFDDGQEWEAPVWSQDGSAIAAELYGANDLYRIAIIPAAGGTPVLVGPAKPSGTSGAAVRFSPDGQSLLVTYRFDNTTWLLPTSGAAGRQVAWAPTEDMDWQRLAP